MGIDSVRGAFDSTLIEVLVVTYDNRFYQIVVITTLKKWDEKFAQILYHAIFFLRTITSHFVNIDFIFRHKSS